MAIAPDVPPPTFGDGRRPVLSGAREALDSLTAEGTRRVWALEDAEVAGALGVLSELQAAVRAQLVAVLAEAKVRGLGAGPGWGAVDWARAHAPSLPTRDLLDAETVATAVAEGARTPGGDHRLGEVVDAVAAAVSPEAGERAGSLSMGMAAQLCRFHRGLRALAEPTWLAASTTSLLGAARGVHGWDERTLAVGIRRTQDLARSDGSVERDAGSRRAHRSLTRSRGPVGMWRYTVLMDEEGAAVIDAAVDALAKPHRDRDTGDLDGRTPAARRADALLDLVSRAVSAPGGVPRQAKTSLVVTIGLDVLQGRCRGAGMTMAGEPLTVGAVRRLACEAQVVPVVLGGDGEVLDQGTARRLFDRAQIRHLWLRDGGCTFPGCSKPAGWTDAHHLVHWVDHGPTDVGNAALLCRAHHTVVHTHRYGGRVVRGQVDPDHDGGAARGGGAGGGGPARGAGRATVAGRARVEWDLTIGSYDRVLEEFRRTRPPGQPYDPGRGRTRPRSLPATT